MKTAKDPRHIKRETSVKALFQYSYTQDVGQDEQAQHVISQKDQIDQIIEKAAPEWPLAKLNRIDLAILRLAVWELLAAQQPTKVVIDEAVELAKQYGAENSPRFINGALGAAIKVAPGKESPVTQLENNRKTAND